MKAVSISKELKNCVKTMFYQKISRDYSKLKSRILSHSTNSFYILTDINKTVKTKIGKPATHEKQTTKAPNVTLKPKLDTSTDKVLLDTKPEKPPVKSEKVDSSIAIYDEETGVVLVESPDGGAQGPIIALSLGLAFTLMLLVFVGCRLRNVKRRIRKGRPLHSNEADYLINGMYL